MVDHHVARLAHCVTMVGHYVTMLDHHVTKLHSKQNPPEGEKANGIDKSSDLPTEPYHKRSTLCTLIEWKQILYGLEQSAKACFGDTFDYFFFSQEGNN